MSADDFDKSEKATPQKLREARKKGQVAKSIEFNSWVMMLFFVLVISVFGSDTGEKISALAVRTIQSAPQVIFTPGLLTSWLAHIFVETLSIIAPIFCCLIVVAIVSTLMQSGWIFSAHSLKPDFTKLNPVTGLKKLFSRKLLFDVFKLLLKVFIFLGLIVFALPYLITAIISSNLNSASTLATIVLSFCSVSLLAAVVITSPIALTDLWFSRFEFARKMRMSKRDLKDEHKRNEGSPEIKSKRQKLQRELKKRMMSLGQVKDADIIVTNPEHYAVALQFRAKIHGVPVVVAKGKGELAAKIRQLANVHNKVILRRPAVARLLYKSCSIDGPVPPESYNTVAQIYNWLYRTGKVAK